ncbi:hypothetical protein [Candidatus Regnicoccus frigidus]|uniref:hypothetical protein n=1 Tax=Candidatus Regnicoccus frigidus TaxID=3074015 RepID=UPI0028BD9B70|nr:hypothetical protein [Candidatus Regnicoccus frigidus]
MLVSPMQNVVAIHCNFNEAGDQLKVGMLVVEAGTISSDVLVSPPTGGAAFYLALPEDVLNAGQRYVGWQISSPIRPAA